MLHNEFEYYLANQKALIADYEGQFVVIKNQKVIGNFPSRIEAYKETKKHHALGTFIIQLCSTNEEAYSHSFHSLSVSF
jgi:hypothetical protein